jgi:DNA-directed RNA polymerase specialized sigma24 family protein
MEIKTRLKLPKKLQSNDDIINHIINHVANYLCGRFTFGYYGRDDIYQEIWLIALKAIQDESYNGEIPLENYLIIHVKNRLINLKRNKYSRKTSKEESRKSLMNAAPDYEDFDSAATTEFSPKGISLLEHSELSNLIDEHLPSALRQDYLRLRDGYTLPEHRKQKIRETISAILEDANYEI